MWILEPIQFKWSSVVQNTLVTRLITSHNISSALKQPCWQWKGVFINIATEVYLVDQRPYNDIIGGKNATSYHAHTTCPIQCRCRNINILCWVISSHHPLKLLCRYSQSGSNCISLHVKKIHAIVAISLHHPKMILLHKIYIFGWPTLYMKF